MYKFYQKRYAERRYYIQKKNKNNRSNVDNADGSWENFTDNSIERLCDTHERTDDNSYTEDRKPTQKNIDDNTPIQYS